MIITHFIYHVTPVCSPELNILWARLFMVCNLFIYIHEVEGETGLQEQLELKQEVKGSLRQLQKCNHD